MAVPPRYHEVALEGDAEKGETDQFITETIQGHQRQQQLNRGATSSLSFLGLIAAFCLGSLSTATIGYFQSGIQATSYGLYEKGWIEEKISKSDMHTGLCRLADHFPECPRVDREN